MGKRLKEIFIQITYTNGQKVHEKMPNIIDYMENEN